ncbi:MAG TPA: M1 family aminopeptidase [Thermoanaerobaculia bacterium]|nr:M1 family aminopeptidase [Thermoanaerobaculia bacterium]
MRHVTHLLLVLCLAVPTFAAPTAAGLVQQYRTLTVGEGKAVSGFKVDVGHMTLVLGSGTVAPVMAGEQQVGLFLHGSGTFTYETVNKDELPVLRHNAKNVDLGVQPTAAKATITETFKSVLLRGNGLPEVTGDAAAAPGAPFQELRELFERQALADPAEYLFVLQALNAPASRAVRADVNGVNRPYVYVYDDVWSRNESLALLRRPEYRTNKDANWLYTTPLSRQAIGRDNRVVAPANVRLTDLDVTLVNTDGADATLTVVETLVPQRPLSALQFDQFSELYFDINREPRRYNVRSVTDEQGNQLSFQHEIGTLLVGLAQPAPAGKPFKLKFEIDGNILYRPEGSNYWELGIAPWFPSLRANEMAFTYHSLLKVKKPFTVFTSGKTLRREAEGEWNVLESRLEQPVSSIAILAGKYQFDEETQNGLTVRVASFIVKNPQAWKSLRSIAFAAAELYPRFLGPFPFDEITIIERNDYGYGQAPAGLVFITKEAFTPKQEEANEFVQGINLRIAHELAHMYWGNTVLAESPEDQWIEEAFAEYSAATFMKDAGRPGEYTKAFANWKADAKDATNVATIPTANRIVNPGDPVAGFLARQGLIYAKGAVLLAALHRELGDEAFLTFLKSYQKSFKGKYANTAQVMGLLQFLTKKDYAPFFEQYFYGTAMPDVKK